MMRTPSLTTVVRALVLAAVCLAALVGAASASAMTSDRALDRYFQVSAAQTSADLDCFLDDDLVACERAVRLEQGADLWFDRYLQLSAREWGLPADGPGSLDDWLADPASEPSYGGAYVEAYVRWDGTFVGAHYRS